MAIPKLADLKGIAPGLTGGLSSEDYIRNMRGGDAEVELAALKSLVREMGLAITSGETYECPMGGRAYCLAPHILDPILNRPEVRAIMEGK